ncbi:unnamed protein product [Parajaminaea phylloscopi]
MGHNVFSPAIFFIAFRESLEAALVVGTLMGMLESLAKDLLPLSTSSAKRSQDSSASEASSRRDAELPLLIKRLRKLVLLGAACGLGLAFLIGAAFLAVFYTQSNNLYGKAEELWEGIFCLIATILLTPMALAILRADQSKAKWRKKLRKAFHGKIDPEDIDSPAVRPMVVAAEHNTAADSDAKNNKSPESPDTEEVPRLSQQYGAQSSPKGLGQRILDAVKAPLRKANRGSTVLFTIPFVTTLREGLEGVVFIGGVSLGLPATSIPLAAIVGLFCGFLIGYIVFRAGGFGKIKVFLLFSTCLLLLISSGLFSRCIYYLQFYTYVKKVGDAAAEGGDGNGSFDALNYVWHIDYANPENNNSGWGLLNALCGWNNTGTLGSILSYVFYWLAVIAFLGYSLYQEKRLPCIRQK